MRYTLPRVRLQPSAEQAKATRRCSLLLQAIRWRITRSKGRAVLTTHTGAVHSVSLRRLSVQLIANSDLLGTRSLGKRHPVIKELLMSPSPIIQVRSGAACVFRTVSANDALLCCVQESIVRLINVMASSSLGRTYLLNDTSLIQVRVSHPRRRGYVCDSICMVCWGCWF